MQADLARVERAITAMKAGDPSALHYLYVRYADVVSAYVKSILGERDEVGDVTQRVFLRLPRAISGYEPGGLPFEGWLLRVALRCALDFLRAQQEAPPPEVLETLPPEQREVHALRRLADLSTPEIAARLYRQMSPA
jgi:DNA-directed RNA polymerase specialized sigma24 family protein